LIPILSFSEPPVDFEGAWGSAMAARTMMAVDDVDDDDERDEGIMGFDIEPLRAAVAAKFARRGAAKAEARGYCMLERIAVVTRADEMLV
jgi:hypothetical protein